MKLLAEPCIPFTDIADSMGVSRERIRQLAKRLKQNTGFKRMKTCNLASRYARWQALPLVRLLTLRGYKVLPIARHKPKHATIAVFNRGVVRVHGKRVALKRASSWGGDRVNLYGTGSTRADLYVVSSPRGYFIFPRSAMPRRQTTFMLDPDPRRGRRHARHDYLNYQEAWHFLGEPDDMQKFLTAQQQSASSSTMPAIPASGEAPRDL